MRRTKLYLLSLAAAVIGFAAPALAGSVTVPIDQARIVTFKQPVSTVYVGNPSMADITVIDFHRVFVLGKAFGTTNIIALDASGKTVSNDPLTILGHMASTVTLNRGSNQFTYACAGSRCEAAPVPGDTTQYYQPVMGQNAQRQDMGQKAAIASAAQ